MAIEELEDVLDELADKLGVYGAHCDDGNDDKENAFHCRVCFMEFYGGRIRAAVTVEQQLERGRSTDSGDGEHP